MKFTCNKEGDEKMTLKKFLKNKGVSHRTLSSLKKGNGKVLVDGKKRSLSIEVGKGKITLILPPEKSDENVNGSIYLTDDADTIIRNFKRAVTDSQACLRYCDEQPGIKNLINIYSACTGKTPEEVEREFDGKGYGDFKTAVGEAVVSILKPIQQKQTDLLNNKDYVDQIIKTNAEKAG